MCPASFYLANSSKRSIASHSTSICCTLTFSSCVSCTLRAAKKSGLRRPLTSTLKTFLTPYLIWSIVPKQTNSPSKMNAIRSKYSYASFSVLVVAMIVLVLQISFNNAHNSSLATASTPEVISSKMRTSGSFIRVHAMVRRLFQPPDSSVDFLNSCF